MSTQKNIKIIREICEEQGITIEAIRYSGSYPIFTLSTAAQTWEFKSASSPSTEPSKRQLRDYIKVSQTRAQIKLGQIQVKAQAESKQVQAIAVNTPQGSHQAFRAWLLRPGKTPEQLAFEEQSGKRAKQSGSW